MKIKRKIISILTAIILFVNVPLLGFTHVLADDAVSMNPLFIPITTFVTAGLIGSGMIAKNSQDALKAGGQLVNDIITQIKSSEVAKSEANADYDSPYRVINGGQPEKPNNNNKNGKWVAVAGGALASSEIYANKDAIKDIMSKANGLGGYNSTYTQNGIVSASDLLSQSSASNIALQLAKLSNSAVNQFDKFLHSDFWEKNNLSYDDCFFNVNVAYNQINSSTPKYPKLVINVFKKSDAFKNIMITGNPFKYRTVSSQYLSYSGYYVDYSNNYVTMLNADNVAMSDSYWKIVVNERKQDVTDITYYVNKSDAKNSAFIVFPVSSDYNSYFYFGYKWTYQNPIQFTNNVYNVNMNFDENFQNWLQGQIQGLGGQLIDAVRLGLTSVNTSWNPTQEQIQEGTSPSSVIYQFINNYENPENIPNDEPNTGGEDEPSDEPETEAEPATEVMVDEASQSLFDWALNKIQLPDGFWEKLPFSIPYDMYLLIKAVLPSRSSGRRKMLKASFNSPDSANGITISSYYDASGANLRGSNAILEVPAKWSSNAPVINWDLHFKYTGVDGTQKQFDYVKTVDLGQYAYFAMIIYIAVYVAWMGAILGFIFDSFK